MMLVATETFVDNDGRTVTAGRTHVAPYSDVALDFPERFREASSRFGRSRGITALSPRPRRPTSASHPAPAAPPRAAAPPAPKPAESWRDIPILRADATPRVTVVLSRGALRGIREELDRARFSLGHGFETGGHLFSRECFGRRFEIVTASGLEGEGRRHLGAVNLDID